METKGVFIVNEADIYQEFVACHVIYLTHLIHTTILKTDFRASYFLCLERGWQKWFSKTAQGISIRNSFHIPYVILKIRVTLLDF